MKIFVTGGSGFVGRAILRKARGRNMELRLLLRNKDSWRKLGDLGEDVETVYGDIFSSESLGEGMDGADAVIHLVGIIREMGRQTFERVHFEGARTVIDAARNAGIRHFVHMSAENARPDAPSRYHRTKFEAEEYLRASGLTYTIFRPSMIFGAEDNNLNELARVIKTAPAVPVIGDGEYIWQPVSVDDVAELFVRSVLDERAFNKTYEVRGPEKFTFNKILDLMMAIMGKKKPKIHVPVFAMKPLVGLMGMAQSLAPITPEQMKMLLDPTVPPPENFSEDFPLALTKLEPGLREYMH